LFWELYLLTTNSATTEALLSTAAAGDVAALEQLLARHRPYLRRMVEMQLEPTLQSRVDASDVVQETLLAASQTFTDFLARRATSFRVWLRGKAVDRLVDARRRHLALKRDVRRDFSITDASSMAIAGSLVPGRLTDAAVRAELAAQVREALRQLGDQDQEIIALRHAEGLSNAEAAEILELDASAASKRYGRAIGRLATELRKLGVRSL
jgi:RNA polymerase sigma-70 factor (ECF subfamily)